MVADAATVADAGTVSRPLLLESATAAPPVGAAPLNVTVQVAAPELDRLVGTHAREVGTIGGAPPPVTTPPVTAKVMALPEAEAPMPLTPITVLETPEAIVRLITATVPFEMRLAFIPAATQV